MTEVGEGERACCELTVEVPVEGRESRLSAARGTFLEHRGYEHFNEKSTSKVPPL